MTDPTIAKDKYVNKATEIWFSGKELLRQGQIKGITPSQAREMCEVKYELRGNRLMRETKEDMKLRTGGRSPDIAEAGFILIMTARERLGLVPISNIGGEAKPTGPIKRWRDIASQRGIKMARPMRPGGYVSGRQNFQNPEA
jgi:hypothetical protein